MSLLSTEVEVTLCSRNIKRYEGLGYEIPRRIDKYGKLTVKENTKILVRAQDLPVGSNVIVDVLCDNCKNTYQLSYYNYNRTLHDGKNYCCHCASKMLISGEKHYLWDSQKTEEERILGRRTLDGYVDFIKKVLHRDKYSCVHCGKISSTLHVHHLNSYDWFVEGRTDETNAVALCEECHKNFHSLYGRGKNTKEQFEEWMGLSIDLLRDDNGNLSTAKRVYCIEDNKIYNSVYEFCKVNGIKYAAHAYAVCNNYPCDMNNKSKTSYKSIHGMHILWYDKYMEMTENDMNEYLNYIRQNGRSIKIICLSDGKIFDSISKAVKFYKVGERYIKECCNRVRKWHKKDGAILTWRYYDDYLREKY